jgi:hypothetical protein
MPLGIGSAIYVVNVLPFAYLLYLPIASRRYNILGFYNSSNTRNYYKKWWVRMFFGRFQYTLYTVFIAWYLTNKIMDHEKTAITEFTAFYHDFDLYDAEESAQAKRILDKYIYNKKMNETKDVVLRERAEKDRELKIQAFNKYALDNNL